MFERLSGPGHVPSWLATSADSIFIVFNEYRITGIASCSWEFIRENLVALATIDGNGYAAVTPELTGIAIVDLEIDGDSSKYEIMAWGDLVLAGER